MTNLPNRYFLKNSTSSWISNNSSFSLIFIDLDNFKYVNDTFGHSIGDEVLKIVVHRLRDSLDKRDLLIRQSGDEFIILTNVISNIENYTKKIINNINQSFRLSNKEFKIGASLGVANYPKDSNSLENLIICADIACYHAKRVKNTSVLFTKEIRDKHFENIEIEKELKNAIENRELFMMYQPQMNYNGSIHGVEALVRWVNKNLGFIPPDRFISIAENSGMMPLIGDFIIDTSLKEIKEVQKRTSKNLKLSINISVKQFMEKDFSKKLIERINTHQIDPKGITLEITESIFIDDLNYLIKTFQDLRDVGFTISLDDFGAGYSSLSMLRKIPINELKIDKAFVDDILVDESARFMAKTIINIGKNLDYEIILSEGVEQKEQIELLKEYGCEIFQGYFYSKPLKIDDLESFLEKTPIS